MQTHYETTRLLLEICSPDYCQEVLRFYKKNFHVFQPYDPVCPSNYYTCDYQYQVLSAEYKAFLEQRSVRFYLFLKEKPNHIIGTISFSNRIHGYASSAIAGYKLDENHQHMGYALEAMQKGIEILFEEEKVHRLCAYVMPENLPSIKLLQRLNFSYEGTAKEYACIQGHWTDHLQYSLINHL